jgi:hypothetical protein
MSKIVKAILRIGVGVVQLAISLVVIIALFSAVNVVMNLDFANFIDTDNMVVQTDPSNSSIIIPYNLDNSQGFYEFEDFTIYLDMNVFNSTDSYDILTGTYGPITIEIENKSDTITFGNSSFNWDPDLLNGIAMNPADYNISLFIDVSTTYALGLIPFKLNVSTILPLS